LLCYEASKNELEDIDFQNYLTNFLYKNLEKYSDPLNEIKACLDYILTPSKGGHVLVAVDEKKELMGVVFLANTQMGPFVPDLLLVYIAVDAKARGQKIGQQLIAKAQELTKSPIALHVEHDNPAKRLYEKTGFTNKYTEMRWYP